MREAQVNGSYIEPEDEAGDGAAKGDAALAAVADREARRAVERDGVAPLCRFVAALLVARVALFHAVHHLLEGLVLGVLAVGRVRVRHRGLWCRWSSRLPGAREAQINGSREHAARKSS